MASYLITNGTVVNDDTTLKADVFLAEGIVKSIGTNLEIPSETIIIDATDKFIIPGGIDSSTKLQSTMFGVDSADDFFSGSRAALAGGTTTLINVCSSEGKNVVEAFDCIKSLADREICCDYLLQVDLKSFSSNTEEEIQSLTSKGANTIRISMLENNFNDKELLSIFKFCSNLGILPVVHAENADIINFNQKKILESGVTGPEGHLYSHPYEVEEETTNKVIVLAHSARSPLFISSITSIAAAEVIARKREKGFQVYGESLVAALATDGKNYLNSDWNHAAAYVVSPPLRLDPETATQLLQLLSCGVLQATGSSHAPYSLAQREIGKEDFTKIPQGVNGIEFRLSIIWEKAVVTGIMDIQTFVAITSSNAAKIFNIYPRKGKIAVGSDADIIIWNQEEKIKISSKTHQQAADFNIFEGIEVHGIPEYVFTNGRLVVENKTVNVERGAGHFISTAPFSPYVFSRLKKEQYVCVDRTLRQSSHTPEADESKCMEAHHKLFYARPPTKAGQRNLQDSTFSLTGTQIDENEGRTTGVKLMKPNDHSTQFW